MNKIKLVLLVLLSSLLFGNIDISAAEEGISTVGEAVKLVTRSLIALAWIVIGLMYATGNGQKALEWMKMVIVGSIIIGISGEIAGVFF